MKVATEKGVYEVIWPRGKKAMENVRLAKRLDTLEGKTVGEIWDWVFSGDKVFTALEKELAQRYPGIKFVNYEVFGSTHGVEEGKVLAALKDKLKQNGCDAVISGMGC